MSILLEYLPNSDLYSLLNNKNVSLDWETRLHFALDISLGMVSIFIFQIILIHPQETYS